MTFTEMAEIMDAMPELKGLASNTASMGRW